VLGKECEGIAFIEPQVAGSFRTRLGSDLRKQARGPPRQSCAESSCTRSHGCVVLNMIERSFAISLGCELHDAKKKRNLSILSEIQDVSQLEERMSRTKQLALEYPVWGGARKGAGRKRAAPRSRVVHSSRPRLTKHLPAHVTLCLIDGLPTLRQGRSFHVLTKAIAECADRSGFRILHYSVMSNHVHLVCEADDAQTLARGIQSLCVRIARGIHLLWHRTGKVFRDRYHSRPLKTPTEVRNTLIYVLQNALHHGLEMLGGFDPYSSACWFDGWKRRCPEALAAALRHSPLPRARSWLMTLGWRKRGLIPASA
jgi:REP element-mobilizing transposase RayT